MIRICLLLATLASPAMAWDFVPGQPCELIHEAGDGAVHLTYDPSVPIYTISVSRSAPFDPAPFFAIRFLGGQPNTISTTRHLLSEDRRTVSVADSGFGNVLNGLQFNQATIAILGDQTVAFSLTGAAEPVAAFRACEANAPTS